MAGKEIGVESSVSVIINGIEYAPKEPLAAKVSVWGMFESHHFKRLKGKSVAEVIENWRNEEDEIAFVGDAKETSNLGRTMLCPITVFDARGKELRRVGAMVFRSHDGKDTPDEEQLAKWRDACLADPDIPRLLERGSGC